jgi:hypothetical protein
VGNLITFAVLLLSSLIGSHLLASNPDGRPNLAQECGTYTDSEIRAKFKFDKNAFTEGDCLLTDIIPNGECMQRRELFDKLRLDIKRLGNFRTNGINRVEFLKWDLSQSYSLSLMTNANDPLNLDKVLLDPGRNVYGVRILLRNKR